MSTAMIVQNLEMTRGDDRELLCTVVADDDSPFNLTGQTLHWTLKAAYTDEDADAIAQKSTAAGIVITDGPGGLATVAIAAADTEGVAILSAKPVTLYWDLQLSPNKRTIAFGKLLLYPDATRA